MNTLIILKLLLFSFYDYHIGIYWGTGLPSSSLYIRFYSQSGLGFNISGYYSSFESKFKDYKKCGLMLRLEKNFYFKNMEGFVPVISLGMIYQEGNKQFYYNALNWHISAGINLFFNPLKLIYELFSVNEEKLKENTSVGIYFELLLGQFYFPGEFSSHYIGPGIGFGLVTRFKK